MRIARTYLYKTIALLIISAFVYVQITALKCGIDYLVNVREISHHQPLAHEHHHDSGNAPHKHHHDTDEDAKNEKDCCSNFTEDFFSVFSKSSTINSDFSFKTIVIDFVLPYSHVYGNKHLYKRVDIVNDPPLPPPKIPDIRVFIHSFQV